MKSSITTSRKTFKMMTRTIHSIATQRRRKIPNTKRSRSRRSSDWQTPLLATGLRSTIWTGNPTTTCLARENSTPRARNCER